MDIKDKIRSFLESNQILSLATTNGEEVSSCDLHYYSDADMNLYFVSRRDREHCKNILIHPQVAISIYDKEHFNDTIVSGMQLKGICTPFLVNDGAEMMKAYYEKFPEKYNGEITEILETVDFRSFFKIKPTWVRVIDGHSWDMPYEAAL